MSAARAFAGASAWASLRLHHNYRLYFGGQVVSLSGTWMQTTAQAWLVLQLTGSPEQVGLLAVFQFGPYAVLGLFGGVLADRFDRRRILLWTQSLPIVLATSLCVLAATHTATVWEVDVIAALNGVIQCADTPARQSFVVELVGRKELRNALALNSSLFNASRIVGPGLAGILISAFGTAVCFGVNAVSYVAVVASLLLLDRRALHREEVGRGPTVLRGIAEGVVYSLRTPTVRLCMVLMLAIGTASVNFTVILPLLASETLHQGAATLGLLSASFGAGALCGALIMAGSRRPGPTSVLVGALGLGIAEILLAPQRTVVATAALLALTGLAFSTYASNSNATIQLAVPAALRGRVVSLYFYLFIGTTPIGGWMAGWLAARGGTDLALVVGGSVAVAAAAWGAVVVWRHGGDLGDRHRRPTARAMTADATG